MQVHSLIFLRENFKRGSICSKLGSSFLTRPPGYGVVRSFSFFVSYWWKSETYVGVPSEQSSLDYARYMRVDEVLKDFSSLIGVVDRDFLYWFVLCS